MNVEVVISPINAVAGEALSSLRGRAVRLGFGPWRVAPAFSLRLLHGMVIGPRGFSA